MHMLFVRNIFLVEMVHLHLFLTMRRAQKQEEVFLELVAVVVDVLLRIFAHEKHTPNMRFGLCVHLEAVLIAHLALADLECKLVAA